MSVSVMNGPVADLQVVRIGRTRQQSCYGSAQNIALLPFPGVYSVCMREYDEPDPELIRPEDFLAPDPIPLDARRMGLDRNTEEGALLALAASLDPAKLSHKIIAWVLLFVFATPVLLVMLQEIRML
jgi:hypothetical protein